MEKFSDRVRKKLRTSKVTLTDLAVRVGLTDKELHAYLDGKSKWTKSLVCRVSMSLGEDLKDFALGTREAHLLFCASGPEQSYALEWYQNKEQCKLAEEYSALLQQHRTLSEDLKASRLAAAEAHKKYLFMQDKYQSMRREIAIMRSSE